MCRPLLMKRMGIATPQARKRWVLPVLVPLLLGMLALHLYQFHERPYRADEAWSIYLVLENDLSGVVQRSLHEVHPPGWILLVKVWVSVFGHTESLTRALSHLLTVFGLACLYRLAADLYHQRIALIAVATLGSLPFVQFYSAEIRPYAPLLALTSAYALLWLRWLRRPSRTHALALLIVGLALVYTHYFGAYVVAAHYAFTLLLWRWHMRRYMQATLLTGLLALGLGGWVLLRLPQGFRYDGAIGHGWPTDANILELLWSQMRPHPEALAVLFLIAGGIWWLSTLKFNADANSPVRFARWREAYAGIVFGVMLVGSLLANLFFVHVTARNLIILLPTGVLVLVWAISHQRQVLLWLSAAIIILTGITVYEPLVDLPDYPAQVAYIAAHYDPANSGVVYSSASMLQQLPLDYYLNRRTPLNVNAAQHLNIIQEAYAPQQPVDLPQHIRNTSTAAQAQFDAYVQGKRDIWLLELNQPTAVGDFYRARLQESFAEVRARAFEQHGRTHITQYRRIPSEVAPVYRFGPAPTLMWWDLRSDHTVAPCSAMSVETWWQAEQAPEANYMLTLSLADQQGQGIVNENTLPADIYTGLWQAGRYYVDESTLRVPCDAPEGDYNLVIGFFDEAIQLQPVTQAGGAAVGRMAYLTTLRVRHN